MRSRALGRNPKPPWTHCRDRASLLWRLRGATTMETGLFEIQSGHLRDYRQSRQLLPDSRDIIHTVFGRADSAGAHAVSHSAVGKMEPLPNSRKTLPIPMSISRSIVSVAMKLPYGARPAGFYMRSRRLIAASQKSECAAFGLRATTELS